MNYQAYRTLFLAYALQPQNNVASFTMSDDDRVLALQPDEPFPQMQLDAPTWRPSITRGGRQTVVYEGSIAIIASVENDDWAGQDAMLDDLEEEMKLLIAYLDYKRKDSNFGKTITLGEVFPIKRYEHANVWGWGMNFSIESSANFCHDTDQERAVYELTPVWTNGKAQLDLTFASETFSVTWTDQSNVITPLNSLKDQINTTLAGQYLAHVYLKSLVIVNLTPATPVTITHSADSHTWNTINT